MHFTSPRCSYSAANTSKRCQVCEPSAVRYVLRALSLGRVREHSWPRRLYHRKLGKSATARRSFPRLAEGRVERTLICLMGRTLCGSACITNKPTNTLTKISVLKDLIYCLFFWPNDAPAALADYFEGQQPWSYKVREKIISGVKHFVLVFFSGWKHYSNCAQSNEAFLVNKLFWHLQLVTSEIYNLN